MLRKAGVTLLALIAAIAIGIVFMLHRTPPPRSQAFINATVLTMNEIDEIAEAVFVERDRTVAVESRREIEALIEADTEIHDLGGRTLLPGIIQSSRCTYLAISPLPIRRPSSLRISTARPKTPTAE